jgi:biotin carboxyl carrier protein
VRDWKGPKKALEDARAEVVRTDAEVRRLTPMVVAGQSTQAELDGARANYDRAQERFKQAQGKMLEMAHGGLGSALQPNAPPSPAPPEQTVVARASSAGKVTVINVRVGERVNAGQPLAIVRADSP